ncbi:MAG: PAS domain-containing protein [Planctomycetes bacterium]|nr:PAS domain-containing protein [Planctomycetota bacterium]
MPKADGDRGKDEGRHEPSLPRGLRTRLEVAVPLAAGFVVLLSSFVVLWIAYPVLFQYSRLATVQEVERRVAWVFTVGGAFTLVALVAAIVVAEWIARPLRTLMSQVELARRMTGEQLPARETRPDADLVHRALKDAVDSLARLVRDGYTLRSLEGGVVTLDQGGVVTSLSPVAERALGCQAAQAIGRRLPDLLPADPTNAAFLESVSQALAGGSGASSAETTVRTLDGRSARLGYTITPLRNEARARLGIVLTFKDLAGHKVAEQLMHQAENLALLGTMAFRLAHEIRNPLTAISALVELIRDDSPPDSPAREHCQTVLESIERLKRLSRELLTLGHPEPRQVEPVDINDLVRNTVALCRHDPDTKGIEVSEDYAADLPLVPGDRERLAEVVLNILRNASRAVRKGGGEIAVATRCAGSAVTVAVRNTGPLIPAEAQAKLFTPFFSTESQGTGLGLAMSQQIVRAHGGRIQMESSAERGTIFTVELPVAGPAPEAVEP